MIRSRSFPGLMTALLLASAAGAWAQDRQDRDDLGPGPAPSNAELDARLRALEADEAAARDDDDDDDDDEEWQLQLRGGWFHLEEDHDDELRKNDGHDHGWAAGVGLDVPVWTDIGRDRDDDGDRDRDRDDDGGVDLLTHIAIEYRQIEGDDHYDSIVDGSDGEISYLNFVIAPKLRFEVTEVFRPYVLAGGNIQVVSPAEDEDSFLDLGFALGGGVDLRVHERMSIGLEYRYTWFGVADQEDEDYGQVTTYVGFNF